MARLAVSKGLHYAVVEEALRAAFVEAARDAALKARPDALPHRLVSKISTTTGLNRREVSRLMSPGVRDVQQRRSPAVEAFYKWINHSAYREPDGRMRALARQGAEPSFDSLAQSVTKDVHPRSILDDLVRLGLVRWNESDDSVELLRTEFVPDQDEQKLLAYLGYSVSDHLHAAVDNVSGHRPKHLEQSLFATGVPDTALPQLREKARAVWRQVSAEWVPELQAKIDGAADSEAVRRVRLGIYMYDCPYDLKSEKDTEESP